MKLTDKYTNDSIHLSLKYYFDLAVCSIIGITAVFTSGHMR